MLFKFKFIWPSKQAKCDHRFSNCPVVNFSFNGVDFGILPSPRVDFAGKSTPGKIWTIIPHCKGMPLVWKSPYNHSHV